MKSIGPYVVLPEASVGQTLATQVGLSDEASPRRRPSRTLRAADRLTGLPVLLHRLDAIAPVPSLPEHPQLLPFTDMVVEVARAYLVTELPPQTEPARHPLRAARAALEVLEFLHSQGLTHGSLNAGQFWEVDGKVRVSGAGLPRPGLRPTPADDLRDLANALEDLGGLPSILALLRTAGDNLSAREILNLLDVGLTEQQLTEALEHLPLLAAAGKTPSSGGEALPVPFDSEEEIVLGGALADEILGLTGPESGDSASLPTGAWDADPGEAPLQNADPRRDTPAQTQVFSFTDAVTAPPAAPPHADAPLPPELTEFRRISQSAQSAQLGNQSGNLPGNQATGPLSAPSTLPPAERPRLIRRAARQASDRLKADNRRRLDISAIRRQRTAATIEQLQGESPRESQQENQKESAEASDTVLAEVAGNGASLPSPQERRRLEQQAWEEQVALDAQLAAARRTRQSQRHAASIFPAGGSLKVEPNEIAEVKRLTRSSSAAAVSLTGQHQKRRLTPIRIRWGKNGERRVLRELGPREALLRWLVPALGVLVVAFAAAALPRALKPAACCEVQFRLTGAATQRASLTLLQAPQVTGWALGRKLGEVPGTLNLPAPGTYRIKVSAEGYAPARVNVTVPTRDPVTVNFGE